MTNSLIESALAPQRAALFQGMSLDAWVTDQAERGQKVALFRRYADGDHDANLTDEMRKLLRVKTGSMNEFNDNYMDIIIQTEADRLTVTSLEAENDAGTEWIEALLSDNRFDGIQTDVHDAALRDAKSYVHVFFDQKERRVRFVHEPAYDGVNGVIVLHDDENPAILKVALKIWSLADTVANDDTTKDTLTKVNVYYPDRIEKYESRNGGSLTRRVVEGEAWPAPWKLSTGDPIGVPFIPFINRDSKPSTDGLSEIENAIPLQNALNRTLYSMVMTAELTAFQIRYIIGAPAPSGVTPGMFIEFGKDGVDRDRQIQVGAIEQGQILPFIQQAQWLTSEIGKVTRTPAPEFMGGDNASGEALKQREIGLIGKVQRFQVKCGNAWEDLIHLAARVQTAFLTAAPELGRVTCHWADPEIRNDKEVVENVIAVADKIGQRETLRQLAKVFGWDEAKIDKLMAEMQTDKAADLTRSLSFLPTFNASSFGLPAAGDNGAAPVEEMS